MGVTSGTVNTNVVSKSNFYVYWSQVSQDVANNKTRINWAAGIYTGTSSSHDSFYSNAIKIYSVYINGTLVSNGGTWSNITTGGNHDLLSGTLDIPHNADGSKSFNVSISAWTYSSANYSGSQDFTLNNIPRQATATDGTNFTDEQNPTVYYSNPAGNSVTTLQAYIENANTSAVLVQPRNITKTATSYTFPLTTAERNTLRNAIPNSKTLSVRLVIKTVIGGNTFYSWVTKTLTIVNANPTIATRTYSDTNASIIAVTENNQIIVQNKSTLQFQFATLAALKGATLTKVRMNINGTIKEKALSGSSVASTTYDYGAVNVSSNTTAQITIIDSRGNSSSYNLAITILEYANPSAIISVHRLSNYYSQCFLTVDARYSSLDEKNTIDIQYRLKKNEDSTWEDWIQLQDNVQVTFTADNLYAWDLQVRLEDILGTITTYNMPKAIDVGIPLVFYDLKNRSVGVNSIPENQDDFEVSGYSYKELTHKGDLYTYIITASTSDLAANAWRDAGTTVTTGVIPKGKYLVLTTVTGLPQASGTGNIFSSDCLIDGVRQGTHSRNTVPLFNGLNSTANAAFIVEFGSDATHTLNIQVYTTIVMRAANPMIRFIRL